MKIKAIFMDMDGTLLNSNNLVSEKLKNKLQELEKKGIKIFIATGRSYAATSNYVREIGIKNPVRRNNLESECFVCHRITYLLYLANTSSIFPAFKNIPSGISSYLPSRISLNP